MIRSLCSVLDFIYWQCCNYNYQKSMMKLLVKMVNSYWANAPFWDPLKTSENLKVFWCFQGVSKGGIGSIWVNDYHRLLKDCWRCLCHISGWSKVDRNSDILGGNSETPYFWYFFISLQAKWTPAVVLLYKISKV